MKGGRGRAEGGYEKHRKDCVADRERRGRKKGYDRRGKKREGGME